MEEMFSMAAGVANGLAEALRGVKSIEVKLDAPCRCCRGKGKRIIGLRPIMGENTMGGEDEVDCDFCNGTGGDDATITMTVTKVPKQKKKK